jgi:hypothetical protein
VEDITGDEPELKLLVEKGDGAKGDGEKGDALDEGGAKGDGSSSACAFGESLGRVGGDDAVCDSRERNGGRPSW